MDAKTDELRAAHDVLAEFYAGHVVCFTHRRVAMLARAATGPALVSRS